MRLCAILPYRFELQIRTVVQDSWSTLDHKIKYKKSIPAALKRRINTLAALFELADREFRQVREETELQIEMAAAEPEAEVEAVEIAQGEAAPDPAVGADIERGQYAPLDAFRLLRMFDAAVAEIYCRAPLGLLNRYRQSKAVRRPPSQEQVTEEVPVSRGA